MATILTPSEAANALRTTVDDPAMLDLLPQVDAYIRRATGRDWTTDTEILPEAKSAARLLLVRWHEDPGGMVDGSALSLGLIATLVQLEAIALRYKVFIGRNGAGPISVPGAHVGDTLTSVVGLIGATGDQSSAFETVVTVDGQIQQVSTANLSEKWYRAYMKPLEDL